jgi:hypothetical protein
MVHWWLVPLAFVVGFYVALFLLTMLHYEGSHSLPYRNTNQSKNKPTDAPTVSVPVSDNWVPESSETVKGLAKASKDR